MYQRPIRKAVRATSTIARFYVSLTGLVLLVGLLLGAVLALVFSPTAGLISVMCGVGVIVPYRLMQLDAARVVTGSQLTALRGADESVRRDLAATLTASGAEVEKIYSRVQQVRRDLLGTVATLREESNALLRSERTIWTDAVATLQRDVEAGLRESARDVRNLEGRSVEGTEQTRTMLNEALSEAQSRTDARTNAWASRSHLRFARRDASSFNADRVLLIVAPQCVGGTWLFDLLRLHPAVGMHPAAEVFDALGAVGRRYPAALSDGLVDGIDVEVQSGVGGLVPFAIADRLRDGDPASGGCRFMVERVHPSAIGFDADGLVSCVAALRRELGGGAHAVQPMYMVREPGASIRSFAASRQRDPEWQADVPVEFTHDFYRRSYEAVLTMHERLPGPLVTWEQMNVDPAHVLAQLLMALGVEANESHARNLATAMVSAAGRLGDAEVLSWGDDHFTAPSVELGVGSADPGRAQEAIDRCRHILQHLSRTSAEAAPASVPLY